MKKTGSRMSLVRLAICICAVAAAAVIERYVPALQIGGDAAAVFAAIGKVPLGENQESGTLGEAHAVLSIPEVPQTTACVDKNPAETAATVTIAYAAE